MEINQTRWHVGWLGWLSFAVSFTRGMPNPFKYRSATLCLPWLALAVVWRGRRERWELVLTLFARRELTLVNGWRPSRWEGGGGQYWYFLPVWKSKAPRDIVWAEDE